jgi:hypothetical protein
MGLQRQLESSLGLAEHVLESWQAMQHPEAVYRKILVSEMERSPWQLDPSIKNILHAFSIEANPRPGQRERPLSSEATLPKTVSQ